MPRDLTRRELFAAAGLAAAGLAVSRGTARSDTPANAWTDLRQRLRGSLVLPDDPAYQQLATPRNLRYAAVMPKAVALCADHEDVAATLAWARKTNTPFAIRGGGHSYIDASSSAGLIISTSRMNAARIDGTTLWAQAGVRNADLAKLLPASADGRLLLPGGNCPAVGIVGLTLGGGIGPNAPWAGLTADRLRRVTMVTAGGDVVTAGATENADLFWGLRGGAGGNFGVVTELEYDLVEVPVTRATTALLTVSGQDAAVAVTGAFQKLRAEADRIFTGSLRLRGVEARVRSQLLAGADDARGLLGPLLAIPGISAEITERSWWDAYNWYVTPPAPPNSFWDRSLYADDYLSDDAIHTALDVVRRFPDDGDPERRGALALLGWVGGAVSDVAADATAYVHRAARILVELTSAWPTPAPTGGSPAAIPPDIREWEAELWDVVLPHTNGQSYQNFPDPELADWASAYYGDNLAGLQGLKAAWDPDGVFTHDQGISQPR